MTTSPRPPLTGKTRLVGVIGWPIEHSVSPPMHNAAFEALGLDWCYVPFAVAPEPAPADDLMTATDIEPSACASTRPPRGSARRESAANLAGTVAGVHGQKNRRVGCRRNPPQGGGGGEEEVTS